MVPVQSTRLCSPHAVLLLAVLLHCVAWCGASAASGSVLYWSEDSTWALVNGTHTGRDVIASPRHGDDLVVPCTTTLVLDVAETPVLNRLVVLGALVFSNADTLPIVDLRVRCIASCTAPFVKRSH